jgi:glycine oxidase
MYSTGHVSKSFVEAQVTTAPEVIVVGGGVVGSACARQIAMLGRRVRLIERGGEAGEGWRASAGMLAPQVEASIGDEMFELGVAGREFYRDQAAQLRESTGIDIGLWEGGILQIAASETEVEVLRERVAWQRQHGHHCEWLDPDEVRRDWPGLGATHGGLLAPRDGSVEPDKVVQALRADGQRLGVELVTDTVTALARSNGRITGVQGKAWHPADHVVLAAGAWSGRIGNLPRPVSVEPVRGQMVAYPWPRQVEPFIVFSRGTYVLHRHGEALAGSTMEHAGFAAEVTEAGIAGIRTQAEVLLPALAGVEILRAWAGLRPGTPDGLPIVGREPTVDGLWYATGHGRSGVLLAGITGTMIAQLMSKEATLEEGDVLRPERFWSW